MNGIEFLLKIRKFIYSMYSLVSVTEIIAMIFYEIIYILSMILSKSALWWNILGGPHKFDIDTFLGDTW